VLLSGGAWGCCMACGTRVRSPSMTPPPLLSAVAIPGNVMAPADSARSGEDESLLERHEAPAATTSSARPAHDGMDVDVEAGEGSPLLEATLSSEGKTPPTHSTDSAGKRSDAYEGTVRITIPPASSSDDGAKEGGAGKASSSKGVISPQDSRKDTTLCRICLVSASASACVAYKRVLARHVPVFPHARSMSPCASPLATCPPPQTPTPPPSPGVQEEDAIEELEVPCSCAGTQRHAHHACIQRWVDEKVGAHGVG
jgi:hypothetical protein